MKRVLAVGRIEPNDEELPEFVTVNAATEVHGKQYAIVQHVHRDRTGEVMEYLERFAKHEAAKVESGL